MFSPLDRLPFFKGTSMKKLKIALGFLIALVLVACFGLYFYLNSWLPKRSQAFTSPEVSKTVTVHYDSYGIPHIEAETEEEAFFALGYAHAQDRLFQMELLRRLSKGELSSILGKDFVKVDKFFRTLSIKKVSKRVVSKIDHSKPQFKILKSYLAGINRYMDQGGSFEHKMLGIPLIPFTMDDTIAISGYMSLSFSQAFKLDPVIHLIKTQFPKVYYKDFVQGLNHDVNAKYQNTVAASNPQSLFKKSFSDNVLNPLQDHLPGIPLFIGSNAWVISGSRTKSGLPILANDPHIAFAAPAVWYEAHIKTKEIELYGHYIAGIPFAPIGHTPNKAWGMTMLQNDDMFFYKEKLNPKNENQIFHKGEWKNLKYREEIIKIKGEKAISFSIAETPHGPIINEIVPAFNKVKKPVSLWWAFLNPKNDLVSAFYGFTHEKDFKKLPDHLKSVYAPGLNLLYADNKNNIAWWPLAQIPKLPKGFKTKELNNGSKKRNEIKSFIPFHEKPHLVNPEEGFIVSANSDPLHIAQSKHRIPGYFCNKQRYMRIKSLIEKRKEPWTLEAMKQIQQDDMDLVHEKFKAKLFSSLKSVPIKQEYREISKKTSALFDSWKGTHKAEEIGPSLYYAFLSEIVSYLFARKIPEKMFEPFIATHHLFNFLEIIINKPGSIWWHNGDKAKTQAHVLVALWERSLKKLSDYLGSNPEKWHWGKIHIFEPVHAIGRKKPFNHIFNIGPKGADGGYEVINNLRFNLVQTLPFKIRSGPSTRRLVDLSDTSFSLGISPTGQSGYFWDKHYKDQFELYTKGAYRKQIMNMDFVKKNYKEKIVIQPESN